MREISAAMLIFFITEIGAAPLIGPNGNAYEFISTSNISWNEANNLALSSSFLGISGHLVTILNQEENDFALNLTGMTENAVWLGGSDSTTEGAWNWISGEQFWTGNETGVTGPDSSYANWVSGIEPNNGNAVSGEDGEDYLSMFGGGTDTTIYSAPGLWNDLPIIATNLAPEFRIGGYIVEYEISEVPIPAPALLLGSGLLILLGNGRMRAAT